MFNSVMETARNSSFKNPFLTTVNCDSDSSNPTTKTLVPGRNIAAAAAAVVEGGKYTKHSLSKFSFVSPVHEKLPLQIPVNLVRLNTLRYAVWAVSSPAVQPTPW